MTENKHLKFWVALSYIVHGRQLHAMYNFFDTGEDAWLANEHQLMQSSILTKSAKRIVELRKTIDPDECVDQAIANDIKVILISDPNYPILLKQISDPPALLYYKGILPTTHSKLLAMVGSRKTTDYSKTVSLNIAKQLAKAGVCLVSGLARGVDSIAHKSCVAQNTKTIAVVANGLGAKEIYPAENKNLAEQIINTGGCLISEYPVNTQPEKYFFPERNRIIAGMTEGTLVTSAPLGSGTLITAYSALDENREVFAIPGPITDPLYEGSNGLLKRGAHVVTESTDIFNVLNWEVAPEKENIPNLEGTEKTVYDLLTRQPLHIDEIINLSTINGQNIIAAITILELKGYIKDVGGKRYVKI